MLASKGPASFLEQTLLMVFLSPEASASAMERWSAFAVGIITDLFGLNLAALKMVGFDVNLRAVLVRISCPLMTSHQPRNRSFWPSGLGNCASGGIMKVPVGAASRVSHCSHS